MEAPAFEAPWHAQVFAITVLLSEKGVFSWPEWTEAFGAGLAAAGRDLDGGDDYFAVWLSVLEGMLDARAIASPEAREALRAAWEAAFLSTPHGAPVRLPN